jgi:NAD(P)H-flavin reductase
MKNFGSWTHNLYKLAESGEPFEIKIDGPYGAPPNLRKYNTVAMFATGSGAAPFISMLRDLLNTHDETRKVVTLVDLIGNLKKRFRNGSDDHTQQQKQVDLTEMKEDDTQDKWHSISLWEGVPHKVYFFWTVRHESDMEWFQDTFKEMATKGVLGTRFEIHVWVTRPTEDAETIDPDEDQLQEEQEEDQIGYSDADSVAGTSEPTSPTLSVFNDLVLNMDIDVGSTKSQRKKCATTTRPNGLKITKGMRPVYKDIFQELKNKHKENDKRLLCLACGPSGMMWKTSQYCQRYSGRDLVFDFHKETFFL